MNRKIIFFSLVFLLMVNIGFAQKKNEPKSIISDKVSITKYHDKEELERMQKGELLGLYIERIEVLIKTLPYIAFATKPGVTMTSLGIPDNKDNRNMLDDEFDATQEYLKKSTEFQQTMLPYSDTSKLIAAILFYEETLKSLHEYSEFH
ncbi:hypothetical protein V8G69_12135 [Gaetbulibacter sp. M235]|uniref:hypothetical protein n=1 Tax=Gaetbulibacter sp. M235 TaxID=3126510 RepID=UPI00374FD0AA